jgi:hypothetical protein
MAKKPKLPKLFWLTYRRSDGRAAGVVVIESGVVSKLRWLAPIKSSSSRPDTSLTRSAASRSRRT